jgi:glycosyltransferase involved in cell wall biosynthesis
MSSKKKLIIDGQIFQTAAKDRGMGRYSVCLIQALLREKNGYEKVEILLTKNLPITQHVQQELAALFDGATLHSLDLQTTQKNKIETTFDHNKQILDTYVRKQISANYTVDYLIPSMFQEPISAVFPDQAGKFLIFYDLIPYLYHRRYMPIMNFENYMKRFKHVFEADRIFTISQTVADDLHMYLGLPKSKLSCIDGAAIRATKASVKPSVALPESFILMPTSDDPRKNNLRAVMGFEEFRVTSGNESYKLVITSKINKRETEYLRLFSHNLVFTGNLPEEELEWLYENCQSVLFVPEYEGLGLPVLEAVEFGKNVVCSSTSVFKEISEDAFLYCEYDDPSSIALALEKGLSAKIDPAKYDAVKAHYTWQKTAKRLAEGLQSRPVQSINTKARIAIFTPAPTGPSAAGKIVLESHAVMSEHFDIDYYFDRETNDDHEAARPNLLQYIAPAYSAQAFGAKAYADYEAVIYNISGDGSDVDTFRNALYIPGYAVLHATDMDRTYQTLEAASMILPERVDLEKALDKTLSPQDPQGSSSLLAAQLGVLAYSAQTAVPDLPAFKAENKLIIGIMGTGDNNETMEFIEQVTNNAALNDCVIWLFGLESASQETTSKITSYKNVYIIDDPTDFEFQSMLSKMQIFVNCLAKSGNVSISTIEAMRNEVATIVNAEGWHRELSTTAVVKAKTNEEALKKIQEFARNLATARALGKRAKTYVGKNFSHEQYALGLKKLIRTEVTGQNRDIAEALRSGRIKSGSQYVKFLKESSA